MTFFEFNVLLIQKIKHTGNIKIQDGLCSKVIARELFVYSTNIS